MSEPIFNEHSTASDVLSHFKDEASGKTCKSHSLMRSMNSLQLFQYLQKLTMCFVSMLQTSSLAPVLDL